MTYPNIMLRGITDGSVIDSDGRISSSFIKFEDKNRDDEKMEASITWHESDEAYSAIWEQKKEGTDIIQFKCGVAHIPRERIDGIKLWANVAGLLSYEKKEIPGNRFHGNILLNKSTSPQINRTICGLIASMVEKIDFR
jgi:hypothetical protein